MLPAVSVPVIKNHMAAPDLEVSDRRQFKPHRALHHPSEKPISCEYAADYFELLIAFQAPVMILARRIEHPLDMAGQRSHEADASKYCRPAEIRDQDQGLHCGLPLRGSVDMFRKSDDVIAGVQRVTSEPPSGKAIGSSKSRSQSLLMAPTLLVEFDMRAGWRSN
jgi:hypothetical protein